ncbi:MAG TPA: HNH endonuclease [Paracoccaceae bacterium]|nr:HNH endonuclease [Paracoccaceae bacterium]
MGDPVCPLCGRPIAPSARQNRHHLFPKLRGGKGGEVVLMHRMCHDEIHAVLTEAEIARDFATPEALRAHPRLARFIEWVKDKDPGFHARTLKSARRRSARERVR